MKNLIKVFIVFLAANAFGAFGTSKSLPVVSVEESDFDKFLESLPKVFGLSIGSALTDAEVSKMEKNKKGNELYYFRRIAKPKYCISCDCYVTHEPLQQYYVSGFYAKADRTKCAEDDMLRSMCELADLSLEGDVDKRGLRLYDAKNKRSVSIQTEAGNGCYYLITMKCDDVSKCLGEDDRAAEKELLAKAEQEEKDNAKKMAKENAEYKRLEAERAKQAELEAQAQADKENEFKATVDKNLKTTGECSTDVSKVGVEFPVTSLCGFKFGDSVDCVARLIKSPVRKSNGSDVCYEGELIKPFRKFTFARITFHVKAGLYDVRLYARGIDYQVYAKEDIQKELETIISMLNKKFNIELKVSKNIHGICKAEWEHEQFLLPNMKQMFLTAEIDPREWWLKKDRQTSIESLDVVYTREEDEIFIWLRSRFLDHLGDLVIKTQSHKTFDASNEGFDAL